MTKDDVMHRIQELAAERGGHVSFRVFVSETGINDQLLRRQEWWTGWNNLLAEMGIETRQFAVKRTPVQRIVEAVAGLIEKEGRWPTDDELSRERKRDPEFPSRAVIRPVRKSGDLAKFIVALGEKPGHFAKAVQIARGHLPDKESAGVDVGPNERVKGYVYMLRSGRRFKIGKSSDPSRRYREISLQLPDETHQVHTIPTDDPTGIEEYWMKRYGEKRVRNTEFFTLDATDVQAFKRRKYQ
jgi:hypothetical protein